MLSVGKFPSGQQCNWAVLANPISKSFLFSSKTHKSTQKINHVRIFYVSVLKRSGLCIHATNGQSKGSDSVIEMGEFDEEEDDDDEFFEDEDEEDGDEDEDDEFIPLVNMKEWLANKPTGFGEDKEYDTSIEDKLMEEIEQSRKAQLANINRLKHNPVSSKKDNADKGNVGDLEATPEGFCVSLLNLPKKKNIHRELNAAFKGVPGLLQIVPVVSGNKKTRDPICKGLAFVYFKTENEARRFVEIFSGQSISFGKIQKQINCEMKLNSPKPMKKPLAENTANTALPLVRGSDIPKKATSRRSAKPVDDEERIEENQSLILPEESKKAPKTIKSSSLKLKKEPQEKGGKAEPKPKKKRTPKMNIPGSSNRLKVKDKTLLAGVFSKYMAKEGSNVEQEERAFVPN